MDIPDRNECGRKSESDSETEQSVHALSRLPSPLERRQGSLVGPDLFLPVPSGFNDNENSSAGGGNASGAR